MNMASRVFQIMSVLGPRTERYFRAIANKDGLPVAMTVASMTATDLMAAVIALHQEHNGDPEYILSTMIAEIRAKADLHKQNSVMH